MRSMLVTVIMSFVMKLAGPSINQRTLVPLPAGASVNVVTLWPLDRFEEVQFDGHRGGRRGRRDLHTPRPHRGIALPFVCRPHTGRWTGIGRGHGRVEFGPRRPRFPGVKVIDLRMHTFGGAAISMLRSTEKLSGLVVAKPSSATTSNSTTSRTLRTMTPP